MLNYLFYYTGKVLLMLGKVQFQLHKLLDSYVSTWTCVNYFLDFFTFKFSLLIICYFLFLALTY